MESPYSNRHARIVDDIIQTPKVTSPQANRSSTTIPTSASAQYQGQPPRTPSRETKTFSFMETPKGLALEGVDLNNYSPVNANKHTRHASDGGSIANAGMKNELQQLKVELRAVQSKIASETVKYETLVADVHDLQQQKERLLADVASLNSKLNDHSGQAHMQTPPLPPLSPQKQSSDEDQTHKATRLKFWRRPKIGFPQVVSTSNSASSTNGNGNMSISNNIFGENSRIPNSFSTQNVRVPSEQSMYMNGNGGNNNNSNNNNSQNSQNSNNNNNNNHLAIPNGKFTKSKSTNILDSLLSGDSNQVPLFNSTIQKRADYEGNSIPLIITRCLQEVEKRGLDFEGIYRISGGNSAIVAIENAFSSLSSDPDDKQLNRLDDTLKGDIHAVTSALKRYLRKLPEPIIPYYLYDEFIKVSNNGPTTRESRIAELQKVINKLPHANNETLKMIVQHLQLINSFRDVNKMGYKNLSVVFAPTLARDEYGDREMTDMGFRNDTTELLLSEFNSIF
ncbi:ARHGAP15 Rho GTPase-activating protein 15 [Candida maltosa Xu316]